MYTKIKLALAIAAVGALTACGGGTAVPKNKPKDFKTPTPAVSVTASPNDKCTIKGAKIKIEGKTYTCKSGGRRDPTLRWKR